MSSNSSSFGVGSPQLTSAKPTLVIPELPTLGAASASDSLAAAAAKKRCGAEGCRRKLSPTQLITGACKCGACYCDSHRLPETHTCSVNRRKESDEVLARQLIRVSGDKLGGHRI